MQCLAKIQTRASARQVKLGAGSARVTPRVARGISNAGQPGRRVSFVTRAEASSETTTVDVEKVVKDLQEKWDKVENKTQVIIYGSSALVTLWLANTVVNAVNGVPLLPKLFELVGLGYSSWFVYRYLLFKSSREELLSDIEELKKKIAGSED